MFVKFVGSDAEGMTFESKDLKSREDIRKVTEMAQTLFETEEFYDATEEKIVSEAFKRCGFSAKRVGIITVAL